VLSGRGLCDELITRPEESYRLWCVDVCDLETSRMRRPLPTLGRSATVKKSLGMQKLSYVVMKAGRCYWLRTVWSDNLGYLQFLISQHVCEEFG